ncbi:MAG: UDP-N-acetylmuramoyl-L-alanine--D-glutamate ligase [Armatimonadota bacterium]
MFKGKSIAVFGLGRSGLAVARAAISRGARVTVYDETPREKLGKPELAEEAETLGAALSLGAPFPTLTPESLIVVNPAIDHRHAALQSQKEKVIGEVEFAYRISKAPIIAITGTNGKSTTTAMTVVALRAAGVAAVLCGNIFGSGLAEMPLTDAADQSTPDQVLVAEISSFQLEWVRDFAPIAAAITTITPDHLDRYDSFDDYAATKERIFEHANVKVDGRIEGQLIAGPLNQDWGNPAGFRVIGTHNLRNAETAAALTIAALEWLSTNRPDSDAIRVYRTEREANRNQPVLPKEALEALREFPGLAHRMQFVEEVKKVKYINNSMCTNPAAVVASIESLGTERVHVLVGGVNKDLPFAPLNDYLQDKPHQIYLFGRDASQINQELSQKWQVYDTMKEAFDAAAKEAKDGEIVMLAPGCASMDQFRDFRHRGDVFCQDVRDLTQ